MKYNPYDYQTYATSFIKKKEISALILDMGLGKTVITLTAIRDLIIEGKVSRVLIVAPLRVAQSTWPSEIAKWDHLKDLTYSVAIGTLKERIEALNKNVDIHLINRENVEWLINKSGLKLNYDMVVIDELSSFKSGTSKRFKAMIKLRPYIKRIVGLTGTPSPNGLMDLWAEYRILDFGERLGRYITRYRASYFIPDKGNGMIVYSYKLLPHAEEVIYQKISDITISMKAVDYLAMPEKIINKVMVKLDKSEQKLYDILKDELIVGLSDTEEIDAVNAASLCGKLLQMANGAVYDSERKVIHIHDKKLDALEDLIEEAYGKPVLVAYWFKHDKDRIKSRFNVREILTDKDITDWNAGKIPIAIIHPASAGHGLNLQDGSSILIWFGITWSLELYEQTNARLWRQGQKETVVIHHILTEDTIDEDVMAALARKDKTQKALIAAVKTNLRR